MLRSVGKKLFSVAKQQETFRQKVQYIREMSPYIVPFMHSDRTITTTLLRSYGLLGLSKLCFFGGPLLLKLGMNALGGTAAFASPPVLFFGFGVCYWGSVFFQQMRNLETLKIINIALVETTSKVYRHMLSLGPEFYFSGSQRHILFNLYKAQGAFEHNLKSFTQYFFPVILDVTLSISLMLYYSSPLFALSFLACYTAYAIFTIRYSDKRKKGIRELREVEKRIDFVTSETFANYYNVKYFQQEQRELERYQHALKEYYSKNYVVQHSLGILNTVQRAIFGAGLTANMMLAAHYVQRGILTTGDIVMIQTLMLQFLGPLFVLGSMYRSFQDNLIDIRKITDIMETPASVTEGTKQLPTLEGRVRFSNVNFKYARDSAPILKDLSFEVEAGKFVALVGRSGIGKTTILNLIFRLYDPQSGTIQLDGANLRQLSFGFRKQMAFVSQSPYLFNGTVLENLQYGAPESSEQQVLVLTKRLGLHQIIDQLPQKYHTNVGEKGNIFSGGEKQRIGLIRALLRKPKVLLLDQPTSSLDVQTQQAVGVLLAQLKNTTRIMITHREGILDYCDNVIRIGN